MENAAAISAAGLGVAQNKSPQKSTIL